MTTVFELDLPPLEAMSPEFQADPFATIDAARARSWVAKGLLGIELLSYETVALALRDRRFVMPGAVILEIQGVTSGPVYERFSNSILNVDGERHTRLRRIVGQTFSPRSADRLRPFMRDLMTGLVAPLAERGHGDFVHEVTDPYPIHVICELLGAPRADVPRFSAWATEIFKIFNFNLAQDLPDIERAQEELTEYLSDLIVERRADPREDLLSDLIAAHDEGDRLSHDELIGMASAVLMAGTDTTRNQLAAAVHLFAHYQDQWMALAEDPSLAAGAVEEVMRFAPIILGSARVTTEDVELKGVVIPKGTMVSPVMAAANRDESVFGPDATVFDITRTHPAPQLTFGGGIHYCLGVWLAKAELAEALPILARALGRFELDGPVTWRPWQGIGGPSSLPIRRV